MSSSMVGCCHTTRRRGKVSFLPFVVEIPISSPIDKIDPSAYPDVWYQNHDLLSFRTEAREICRRMRKEFFASREIRGCSLAFDHSTRGLEKRSCLERQRRIYTVRK